MPRISYFYGIVIWMYWDDHNPPHFHATYGEFEILINITDFSVYAGFLLTRPGFRASYGMGVYSSARHLLQNWELMRQSLPLKNIEPLK